MNNYDSDFSLGKVEIEFDGENPSWKNENNQRPDSNRIRYMRNRKDAIEKSSRYAEESIYLFLENKGDFSDKKITDDSTCDPGKSSHDDDSQKAESSAYADFRADHGENRESCGVEDSDDISQIIR